MKTIETVIKTTGQCRIWAVPKIINYCSRIKWALTYNVNKRHRVRNTNNNTNRNKNPICHIPPPPLKNK